MDRQRPRRRHVPRLAIVGAGRAGHALGLALSAAGYPILSVSSRSPASAAALAAQLPGAQVGPPTTADLVLLTVPDSAISTVVAGFPWRAGQAVVHCAGAYGREVLQTAAAAGALTGAWHPLQSLATPRPDLFRGVSFAIEAPPPLAATLRTLTRALGGVPLALPTGQRLLYHLGATIVSNYSVALVALAADLWAELGIDRRTATAALAPLLAGTAANLAAVGLPEALTGPIARGDAPTIARHLAALTAFRPHLLPLYHALGQAALRLARERGLSAERAAALEAWLAPPETRPRRSQEAHDDAAAHDPRVPGDEGPPRTDRHADGVRLPNGQTAG
ncbi:MAG: DUF2520 domain-containing protein [Chloroflexi bacterium]|nr:DUF2520 domain-containing protein [Chloroflexota bacterium]